jgi:hypothetical protein
VTPLHPTPATKRAIDATSARVAPSSDTNQQSTAAARRKRERVLGEERVTASPTNHSPRTKRKGEPTSGSPQRPSVLSP